MYVNNKKAFTMVELVFVIVVIGILAAIAVPRMTATREDAQISAARATIAAVRSGIVSARQRFMLQGKQDWPTKLSTGTATLFDGNGTAGYEILMYPVTASNTDGHWTGNANGLNYTFHLMGQNCNFTYNPANGTFTLDAAQAAICDELVK